MPEFGPKERDRIQIIFNRKWWEMNRTSRFWEALLVDLGVKRKSLDFDPSKCVDEGVTIEDPSGYLWLFVPNEVALRVLVLQEIP